MKVWSIFSLALTFPDPTTAFERRVIAFLSGKEAHTEWQTCFFPLLDMLQKNELLSHLQGRKRSDCFKEMPFAEPLAYVTGHTIWGRAENKPFRKKKTKKKNTACPRNANSKRNNTFWNAKQSSESKSCFRTMCKMLPLLQELGLEKGCSTYCMQSSRSPQPESSSVCWLLTSGPCTCSGSGCNLPA